MKLTVPDAPLSAIGAVMVSVLAASGTMAIRSAEPVPEPAVSDPLPTIAPPAVPGARIPPVPMVSRWAALIEMVALDAIRRELIDVGAETVDVPPAVRFM